MAYSASNPPQRMFGGLALGNTSSTSLSPVHGMWQYRSADTTTTVIAAGYFTNGQDLGMRIGDLVFISAQSTMGSTGVAITTAVVQLVTSTGATVGPGTQIGAT